MNRIDRLFDNKHGNILSVYFTAGFPEVDSTASIIMSLAEAGADMIEIGIPFSDPIADGPVLQNSSSRALKNGMSLKLLFSQLKEIRQVTDIPLLMMGYFNPVLQYGIERFCVKCAETGIDGIILPDLPPEVVEEDGIRNFFLANGLHNICLITPQTAADRVRNIDEISGGFIYMVSSSSTTGTKAGFSPQQISYFEKIRDMNLKNPRLIGFGISDAHTFSEACKYANGAIIGSAFVKMLEVSEDLNRNISEFVKDILN